MSTTTVRTYQPSDREEILGLAERVWGRRDREAFEYLWEWKHARDGLARHQGQCSIVVEKGDCIIGYSGVIPVSYRIDGARIAGSVSTDICTDPAHRGVGVKMLRHQLKSITIAGGIAVPRSAALWARILKRETIHWEDNIKLVYIINTRRLLNRFGVGFASPLLNPLWRLYLDARKSQIPNPVHWEYAVEPCSRFPEECNEIQETFASGFRFSIVHDVDWLNWRFCDAPITYQTCLLRKNGSYCGYFVYRNTSIKGRPVLLLLEMAVAGDKETGYSIMTDFLLAKAREENVSEVRTLASFCPAQGRVLRRYGFLEKKVEDLPFSGVDPTGEVYGKKGWVYFPSDADIEFAVFNQFDPAVLR